ncbi:hypothetical protein [Kribbella sp. CA-293567]|uniref:hypothetical protein n=1 Tax=Kribbella sp. CA-293567 TaxID=3002436 RepID=UPI0022DDD21D|nr:hypothetical protein [Kribbella sp. CA-293567]WBQ05935.1 hypothetical protein OX958_03815 [Kribbella sp. CA-293567]
MADEAQVHAVLTALTEGPMTADRVAASTGLAEDAATKVLDHLVSAVQVAVVQQSEGLPKYKLTPNGVREAEQNERPQDRPRDQHAPGSATGLWSFLTSFWTSQRNDRRD